MLKSQLAFVWISALSEVQTFGFQTLTLMDNVITRENHDLNTGLNIFQDITVIGLL